MSDEEFARAGGFSGAYMIDAAYTQLIGICLGLLADGALVDSEIVTLHDWLRRYQHILPEWPAQALAKRVRDVLSDGLVEEDERAELREFIARAAGVDGEGRFDAPTSLPLDDPQPHIEFEHRGFCITGTFLYGPRRKVEAAIREWGGRIAKGPSTADYLVIGSAVTPSWKFGTHGLKIEEAVEMKAKGRPIKIVCEKHWHTSLC